MKHAIVTSLLAVLMVLLSACGGSTATPKVPQEPTTQKFRFDHVKFDFSQLVTPEIKYHTPHELETMLNEQLIASLKEHDLFSTDTAMNTLKITASYERRFIGDATPFPVDSLAYPKYSFQIEVEDSNRTIRSINKKNLTYSGGFTMNLQVMAGTLRDKKYEVDFVKALANTIIQQIKDL